MGDEKRGKLKEEQGGKLESPGFGTFTGVHNRGFEEKGLCVPICTYLHVFVCVY